MVNELSELRRRPLLAPLLLPMLGLLAAAAGLYWIGSWAETTTIVLLRHAEAAADDGDPDLSPAGAQRAALLGPLLDDLLPQDRIDYLYAADTRRAQQTATSIANEFGLPINLLTASDWEGLASRLLREHRGDTIVVVGYASTLPGLIERLSGHGIALDPREYDALFVVVSGRPGDPRLLRMRYGETSPRASTAGAPRAD
jgi:broad specificity phosphatase PhoE